MNQPLILAFIVSFYVLIGLGASQAADPSILYVDVNLGSDSNDGSQEHPWSTINHAAEEVNPGDTVLIADGTYYITGNIHIATSGD
jgi:hypothetical protein